MIMIRAIVRPEKMNDVLSALMDAGFPAVTKMDVVGRGKQRGVKIGEIHYDELPKELLLTVVKDGDKGDTYPMVAKYLDRGVFDVYFAELGVPQPGEMEPPPKA